MTLPSATDSTQVPVEAARCEVLDWGRVGYDEAIARMEDRARRRAAEEVPDALILLEHDPVVTLGRGAHAENLVLSAERLESQGTAVREAGRGGDVTWHGPGQLVGYPVIALEEKRRDAHRYLRDLEEALILALEDLGVVASRREGLTGVWAGDAKIASIGVRFSRWVTSHGFALNVSNDLSGFGAIVPCGIRGVTMTSVARLTGTAVPLGEVSRIVARRFGEVFERAMIAGEPAGIAGGREEPV